VVTSHVISMTIRGPKILIMRSPPSSFSSPTAADYLDRRRQAARLKEEADRYLHYFNRYFLHETAAKSIPALREKALDKQRVYREITAGNPDFLLEAVDLLERVCCFTQQSI